MTGSLVPIFMVGPEATFIVNTALVQSHLYMFL